MKRAATISLLILSAALFILCAGGNSPAALSHIYNTTRGQWEYIRDFDNVYPFHITPGCLTDGQLIPAAGKEILIQKMFFHITNDVNVAATGAMQLTLTAGEDEKLHFDFYLYNNPTSQFTRDFPVHDFAPGYLRCGQDTTVQIKLSRTLTGGHIAGWFTYTEDKPE